MWQAFPVLVKLIDKKCCEALENLFNLLIVYHSPSSKTIKKHSINVPFS